MLTGFRGEEHSSLPVVSGSNTSSAGSFERIRDWIRQCAGHRGCNQRHCIDCVPKGLPSRLIEISTGCRSPTLRLVFGDEIRSKECQYATLSHCWGLVSFPKLQQNNIDGFRSNIPWNILTKTFQEAVITASRLGVRYLWIDALCIVQDDLDDWRYEAAQMANIYSNSFLNISADASTNGNEGVFRDRSIDMVQSFYVQSAESSTPESGYVCFLDRYEHLCETPLSSRAWAVQERVLAPRVVHFGADQVRWACSQLIAYEGLPVSLNVSRSRRGELDYRKSADTIAELYELWDRVASQYAEAQLTIASDRCVAISGLARSFCHRLGLQSSDYLSGMWRSRLIHQLMWGAVPFTERLPDTTTPSWSWLSKQGGIMTREPHAMARLEPVTQILEARTFPLHDAFGPVSHGYVTLQGPLCKAVVSKGGTPFYKRHTRNCRTLTVGGTEMREEESFILWMDYESDDVVASIMNHTAYILLGRTVHGINGQTTDSNQGSR